MDRRANSENIVASSGPDDGQGTVLIIKGRAQLFGDTARQTPPLSQPTAQSLKLATSPGCTAGVAVAAASVAKIPAMKLIGDIIAI